LEVRQKIKENTPIKIGKQHPRWAGGKSKFWKNKAKERDNYTCQKCGMGDKDILVVDHIVPRSVRPDLDCVIDNLMTLCPNCHARKTMYEKRNNIYKLKFQLP
jgi:5-methylcytosine-specific restriction endonuclease McrA